MDEEFTAGAINAINASYYASKGAFSEDALLANIYGWLVSLNYAIGGLLAESAKDGRLRIKELAAGPLQAHWQFALEGARHRGVRQLELTLTDYVPRTVDKTLRRHKDLAVKTEVYNLHNNLPHLPESERYDVLLSTYGFDSVWLPEDLHLRKDGDNWYRAAYRLKVAAEHPRRDALIAALKEGTPMRTSHPRDYEGITIEARYEPYDLASHPYASYIRSSGISELNFPGGMIARVVQAFDRQLAVGGRFVIGDTSDLFSEVPKMAAALFTGVAARYKPEAYSIAMHILEHEYGLTATALSFPVMAERYLPTGWEAHVIPEELVFMRNPEGDGLLVVERKETRADVG